MNKPSNNPPKGITIHRDSQQSYIARKWSIPNLEFRTFIVPILDILFVYMISLALPDIQIDTTRLSLDDPIGTMFYITLGLLITIVPFSMICGLIAINYYAIALHLNTTIIKIDKSALSISHQPIPFRGYKNISLQSIHKVYCSKFRYHYRGKWYRVRIITNDNKNIKILDGIYYYEEALFIKREIQSYIS